MIHRWTGRGDGRLLAPVLSIALLSMPSSSFARVSPSAKLTQWRAPGTVTTLDMVSPSSGWGWGQTVVVRATNGARRLFPVTPSGINGSNPILGETALDLRNAWIVSGHEGGSTRFTVYSTWDGGARWSAVRVGRGLFDGITFVDQRHGWLETSQLVAGHEVRAVTLSRTVDGGRSWTRVHRTRQRLPIQPDRPHGDCQWSTPRFSTPLHGVVGLSCDDVPRPRIDVTDDGGRSWRRIVLPPLRHPPGTVLFTGVERPLIVGGAGVALVVFCVGNRHMCHGYGSLYHSADSGRTWTAGQTVVRPGTETIFAGLANAWLLYGCVRVCDSTPRLLRTRDGGVHWRSLRLPAGLAPNMHGSRELQFVSPADGFAVSEQEFDPRIHFFRTTDGGMSFHPFEPRVVRG